MADFLSYKQIMLDRIKFQRSGTSHGTTFNNFDQPGAQFFRILFHFYNDPRQGSGNYAGSGLLHPTWQMSEIQGMAGGKEWINQKRGNGRAKEFAPWRYNSAYSYLLTNDEQERAIYLKQFIALLSNINSESPWYFRSVKGIESAIDRKQLVDEFQFKERGRLVIECLPDSVDQRIATLMDLYRAATYSWINKREVLPANLRKFDMSVIVFQVPISDLHIPKPDNFELSDLVGTITSLIGEDDINFATLNPHREGPMIASYKIYEFHNCEFDYNSTTSAGDAMMNDEPFSTTYNIGIFYDDMYEVRYNEFMKGERYNLQTTSRKLELNKNDKYLTSEQRISNLKGSEEYKEYLDEEREDYFDAYDEAKKKRKDEEKAYKRQRAKDELIMKYDASPAGQKAYKKRLAELEKEWAKQDDAERKKEEKEKKEKTKNKVTGKSKSKTKKGTNKDKNGGKSQKEKDEDPPVELTKEEQKKKDKEWKKKQKETKKRMEEEEERRKLELQSQEIEDEFQTYLKNHPGLGIDDARKKFDETHQLSDEQWEKLYKNNEPNTEDYWDYSNVPDPPADTDSRMGQYILREIGDLVLTDTIAWNAWGDDNTGPLFGEPINTPKPDQEGWQSNREIQDAVHSALNSILTKGITNDKGMGNLFGLSVSDVDTYKSVTSDDTASVLKFNYNGYGDPSDLGNILTDDDDEVGEAESNLWEAIFGDNNSSAGIGKVQASLVLGNLNYRHDPWDWLDEIYGTNSNHKGIGKIKAAQVLGNMFSTMSLMSNT